MQWSGERQAIPPLRPPAGLAQHDGLADQKRHVVEDGSHFVARTRLIQETLTWLDKYQPRPQ